MFVRIHKSYLAAIAKISTIELKHICIDDHKIPISRGNRHSLVEAARKMGFMFV
jgi:DNA-binding LytR/AlgR family response regulator